MAKDYAADVPLICDPVPDGEIDGPHLFSNREIKRAQLAWDCWYIHYDNPPSNVLLALSYFSAPCARQRVQWPDAEFCAA